MAKWKPSVHFSLSSSMVFCLRWSVNCFVKVCLVQVFLQRLLWAEPIRKRIPCMILPAFLFPPIRRKYDSFKWNIMQVLNQFQSTQVIRNNFWCGNSFSTEWQQTTHCFWIVDVIIRWLLSKQKYMRFVDIVSFYQLTKSSLKLTYWLRLHIFSQRHWIEHCKDCWSFSRKYLKWLLLLNHLEEWDLSDWQHVEKEKKRETFCVKMRKNWEHWQMKWVGEMKWLVIEATKEEIQRACESASLNDNLLLDSVKVKPQNEKKRRWVKWECQRWTMVRWWDDCISRIQWSEKRREAKD